MRPPQETPPRRGAGPAGLIVRVFLVIGILVALGFGLDYLLGTRPWFILGCTLVGVAAGILELVRTARG